MLIWLLSPQISACHLLYPQLSACHFYLCSYPNAWLVLVVISVVIRTPHPAWPMLALVVFYDNAPSVQHQLELQRKCQRSSWRAGAWCPCSIADWDLLLLSQGSWRRRKRRRRGWRRRWWRWRRGWGWRRSGSCSSCNPLQIRRQNRVIFSHIFLYYWLLIFFGFPRIYWIKFDASFYMDNIFDNLKIQIFNI